MPEPRQLLELAFDRLAERTGFVERVDQRQLALLLADLMEDRSTGLIEAPTGLGKSLACLLPAIAAAISTGQRTVIGTYTNVLAEQYWRQDLPLALSLFDDGDAVSTSLLMGRQRYACLSLMEEVAPHRIDDLLAGSPLGLESEFSEAIPGSARDTSALWRKVVAPAVCPARHCPNYSPCYYYSARRNAENAQIVITNHAVVLQDALMTTQPDEPTEELRKGLLGKFNFLVLDEAHDLPQAAANALEFVLSQAGMLRLVGLAQRMEQAVSVLASAAGHGADFGRLLRTFREQIDEGSVALNEIVKSGSVGGILDVSPANLKEHPNVRAAYAEEVTDQARAAAEAISEACQKFSKGLTDGFKLWREEGVVLPEAVRAVAESTQNYVLAISEVGLGAKEVAQATGESVSYLGESPIEGGFFRHDVVNFAPSLQKLLWDKGSYACLSATLTIDGTFDHFCRITGAEPILTEALPSPFDYGHQAALYLPADGVMIDPTFARKEGLETDYHARLARQVSEIIVAVNGRTLVLFHSRKEMEAVRNLVNLPDHLPILIQPRTGAASVGKAFRDDVASSLFALRSFWTGFDAPGETLSCVVLVRIPFEVPTDPPQIVRMASLQAEGRNPFVDHALPNAKLLLRQGVGRLIRRASDRGLVAVLDARVKTKRYGEELIENLPNDMRQFSDVNDAVGWLGLN